MGYRICVRILSLLPAVLAAPLLLASCGLVHLPGSDDCATAMDGGPPACPCEPPVSGDPCDLGSVLNTCTYGTDPRLSCRQQFACVHGQWTETADGTSKLCTPAAECPSTKPSAGTQCDTVPVECAFPDGSICACGGTWMCSEPQTAAGCPALIPNEGTPCSGNVLCEYDDPCDPRTQCVDGVWVWLSGPC